ncbi:Predicted HD phosphohydrolase [Pseudoduganella namucuonensis]|uniref:Predicted HD phosphohydrolase n=2 Tax=Pseudoduganella namucuonensis TaxID=1035707 RepID=A0A1I7LCX1_9BURK|nr:Predicted HD phosphohydrolase [Pseudoduganella namucuonensis]
MVMKCTFSSLADATSDDWHGIMIEQDRMYAELPGRVIDHLMLLKGDYRSFPVDLLNHSLQAATLAYTAGESEEYVVCTLLHDVGDILGSLNHGELSAKLLQPFVSDENYWMVKHHGLFQGYYFYHHIGRDRNARDRFINHPHFSRTQSFIDNYDNLAFSKDREPMPVEFFEPMIKRVFSSPTPEFISRTGRSKHNNPTVEK